MSSGYGIKVLGSIGGRKPPGELGDYQLLKNNSAPFSQFGIGCSYFCMKPQLIFCLKYNSYLIALFEVDILRLFYSSQGLLDVSTMSSFMRNIFSQSVGAILYGVFVYEPSQN
jgi:hypothetical protein